MNLMLFWSQIVGHDMQMAYDNIDYLYTSFKYTLDDMMLIK